MWPFKKKQTAADIAIEWMPRAIDVAAQKWIEFQVEAFAATMPLNEKIHHFTTGLKHGLSQWEAFKGSPESLFLLIAAKGIEHSRTHFRFEIESALGFEIPTPHVRSDDEEIADLKIKLIDRAARAWRNFSETLVFNEGISLSKRIELFKTPFVYGVQRDYPMFKDAVQTEFEAIIALGIEKSGTNTLVEVGRELGL